MATFFVTTDTVSTTTFGFAFSTTNDDLIVSTGVVLASSANYGVVGLGSNHNVKVLGTVLSAAYSGVELGFSGNEFGNTLYVGAAGSVVSTNFVAAYFFGAAQLTNYGQISGATSAVVFNSTDIFGSSVFNSGTIDGSFAGITLYGNNPFELINTGTIIGGTYCVDGNNNSAMTIINRGLLVGNLSLSGAGDVYDGRGGSIEGDIFGGGGADRFILSATAEVIDGGADVDTLDFRATAGISVSLDGSFAGTGTAAGDSFVSVENLLGSSSGADTLGGSDASNSIRGYGGADSISGEGGSDYLIGGSGKDRLNGGLGNDQFWFEKLTDCGDIISDFSNVAVTNDDRFRITASGFGGGLAAGALTAAQFQSRADNVAQDSNDRFIFRTTDATLWFDANGNASGGLTMVADLQAGAVMTYADILLM